MGLAVMAGQLSGIYTQLGVDTVCALQGSKKCLHVLTQIFQAAHMSEEVKDAAKSVPKAMMSIYLINFVRGL